MGNPATGSSECVRGADDNRIADPVGKAPSRLERLHDFAFRYPVAELIHEVTELLPILGLFDGRQFRPEQFDAAIFKHAAAVEFHRQVEAGLAAKCGQEGVRAFLTDNPFDELRFERFDIDTVRRRRVGHDRGRVRVDEDNLVSFFFQGKTRLSTSIVKFCRLPDDDRTGSDYKDFLNIWSFWHVTFLLSVCFLERVA